MDSEPPIIPRTPPNCSQLSNSVPSQTDSYLESVDPALQSEWSTYSATGVSCEVMLNRLYPNAPAPTEATSEALRLRLHRALSMRPEPAQYGPIADICNDILHEHYESNRATEDRPSRWFIALGNTIIDSNFAQRKPDVVVVIRSVWEEHIRSQLPEANTRSSKDWKKVLPEWDTIDTNIRRALQNPESLKAHHFKDPKLLLALDISPPWECIVSILEFKVKTGSHSTASMSPSVSTTSMSASASTTNASKQSHSRSKGNTSDVAPMKLRNNTPGSSPTAERTVTPSASNNSQSKTAKKPSIPPLAPRKTLPPEVQLLSYFCEVMSAARYRDWTSGAIIGGMNFSLVTCDREGAIKSAPIDLGTVAGANILSRWVVAVGSGTLVQSGFSGLFAQTTGEIVGRDFTIPDYAKRIEVW